MPSRADFQPRETVRFLPLISLIDVIEGGGDYRFRLVGSAVEEMLQTSLTGSKLSEYPHRESAEIMRRMYDIVVKEKSPAFQKSKMRHPDHLGTEYAVLCLPFSDNDRDVNMIIVASQYD